MTDLINAEEIVKMLNISTSSAAKKQQQFVKIPEGPYNLKTDKNGNILQTSANAVILAQHFLSNDLVVKYQAVIDSTSQLLNLKVANKYISFDLGEKEINNIVYGLFTKASLTPTDKMIKEFMTYISNRKIACDSIKQVHFNTFGYKDSKSDDYFIHQLPFQKPSLNNNIACPTHWQLWLQGFSEPDIASNVIKQFVGAIFSNNRPKKVLYLYGVGGGGKTTLQDALQLYLSKIGLNKATGSISASAFDKDDKNGLWSVRDSALAFCDDSGKTALYSSEAFKTFVTGESFRTAEKYIAPITTYNRNTLIMTSNKLPLVTQDEGKRRLIILEKTLPNKMVTNFADLLASEAEAFIQHCIVYYLNTEKSERIDQQRIFTTGIMEEAQEEELAEIVYDLQQFDLTNDNKDKISREDLAVVINQFRKSVGKKNLEKFEFEKYKKYLIDKGCEYKLLSINNNKVRGFTGIKPKEFQAF